MNSRRDLDFVLYEMLEAETLCRHGRFAGQDRELFDRVLDTAGKLAKEEFEPHAAEADAREPYVAGSTVQVIPQVKQALQEFSKAGFPSMGFDAELGGLQLPWVLVQACFSQFYAANISTAAYAMLTMGAANLLAQFGSKELKEQYLAPMLDGRFFGTMCLSEPHVGSSLGDLQTRAEPQPDGTFHLRGSKMWISGGHHEISENIVHLVLARIAGAPPGPSGISLFLVPRYPLDAAGRLGRSNDITLVGLNHKMGYRGTVNTLLNFGENGRCVGYLVGEPNQGLRDMFQMMNEARIAVGLGATMLAFSAYEHSLEYARNRRQGRLPDNKDPKSAPVAIIEHADIKRLLLAQKSSVEGSLALCLFCAWLVDQVRVSSAETRSRQQLLLDILTPIAKSWPSEFCLEANKHAIQILGGHGYTRDHPVERLYRDNRLNAIHEGTHGIQGIDLLNRKVTQADGAAFALLLECMRESATLAAPFEELQEFSTALLAACARVEAVTGAIVKCSAEGDRTLAFANATIYLDMLGHIVIAWMWLWQARIALAKREASVGVDRDFYVGKVMACKYFYRYELPTVYARAHLLERLDDTCLTMPSESF
jgi:alkylation response protein AidB-like acyl-CoA dehydrogenase